MGCPPTVDRCYEPPTGLATVVAKQQQPWTLYFLFFLYFFLPYPPLHPPAFWLRGHLLSSRFARRGANCILIQPAASTSQIRSALPRFLFLPFLPLLFFSHSSSRPSIADSQSAHCLGAARTRPPQPEPGSPGSLLDAVASQQISTSRALSPPSDAVGVAVDSRSLLSVLAAATPIARSRPVLVCSPDAAARPPLAASLSVSDCTKYLGGVSAWAWSLLHFSTLVRLILVNPLLGRWRVDLEQRPLSFLRLFFSPLFLLLFLLSYLCACSLHTGQHERKAKPTKHQVG